MRLARGFLALALILVVSILLASIAYGVIGWKQIEGGIRGLGYFILFHTYNIYDKTW